VMIQFYIVFGIMYAMVFTFIVGVMNSDASRYSIDSWESAALMHILGLVISCACTYLTAIRFKVAAGDNNDD
jgi:hypothetical protein